MELKPRDIIQLTVVIASIAVTWGVTISTVKSSTERLHYIEATMLQMETRLTEHEKLVSHPGTVGTVNDLQRRVRDLESRQRELERGHK